jgi:hypothetical protein
MKNEIVIIGQDMDGEKINAELEACLLEEEEVDALLNGHVFSDNWPI